MILTYVQKQLLVGKHTAETLVLQTKLNFTEKALLDARARSNTVSNTQTDIMQAHVLPVMKQMQSFTKPFLDVLQQYHGQQVTAAIVLL